MKLDLVSIILYVATGFCFGYSAGHVLMQNELDKANNVIQELKLELDIIHTSPEYKAVNTCKNENRWKANCIAWELTEK